MLTDSLEVKSDSLMRSTRTRNINSNRDGIDCRMADIDEDVIPRGGPDLGDTDLSDETQDFRFLLSVS